MKNLEEENKILIDALKNIIDPISYLKSQLKEDEQLNGLAVVMITGKPQFYQDIASEALKKVQKF